jgi:phage terminase large subunit
VGIAVPANGWRPREYQLGLWNARFEEGKDRFCEVWHRRAGKDLVCLNICAVEMLRRVGNYWHVFPTYAQGKKAIWEATDSAGNAFRSYIPPELVVSERQDEMTIEIQNGSRYRVVGADKIDRLVGAGPVGLIMSEYSLMNPKSWDLMRPILRENKGWAIFIYTPRGYNHGWRMLQAARVLPDRWHHEILDVTATRREDGTPVVTEQDIEEDRIEGMPEELIQQEYFCDFTAPLVGSYYGKALEKADREGRIVALPPRKDHKVHTCWDLGISDAMVIWFLQVIDGWIHWIDYYAAHGAGLEHYAEMLQSKAHDEKYIYGDHYAPHDIRVRELGTGVSRFETAWRLGLRFTIAPFMGVEDGINACRMAIERSRFDQVRCEEGLTALRHYRKEWSDKTQTWGAKPVHDWSSHPADAFRTGCTCIPSSTLRMAEPPRYEQTVEEIIGGLTRKAKYGHVQRERI